MAKSNQRRNYKDTVFVDLFAKCADAKKNFLSLYNALHGTELDLAETKIEPVILEQTIYTGRQNDVSMLVDGKIIVLIEQQSTINENIPLRFLEYVSRLYEKLIPLEERYKQKLIQIPFPEFYVFYNGNDDYPAEKELRLSSAFKKEENKKNPLELNVLVYNINKSDSLKFLEKCDALAGYIKLVKYAQEAKSSGMEDFLDFAVKRCIKEGFLSEYLKQNSTEVRNMLIGEYDYETDIRIKKQESYEEGVSFGIEQGIEQGAAKQKEEDEKLLSAEREQNAKLNERILQLEAALAEK